MCLNVASHNRFGLYDPKYLVMDDFASTILDVCTTCLENYRIFPDRRIIENYYRNCKGLHYTFALPKVRLLATIEELNINFPGFFSDDLIDSFIKI